MGDDHEEDNGEVRAKSKRFVGNGKLMKAYTALKDGVEAMREDMLDVTEEDPDAAAAEPIPAPVPSLVVTGTQSAGKTTFIETMVGFPVGLTARGTGTRCPVRYILRPLRGSEKEMYFVASQDVQDRKGLLDAVTKKMTDLASREEFESEPLDVEIHEANVLDMDIIDLPGLLAQDGPDQTRIVEIVKGYVTRHDVTPVVLTRAMPSPENQLDIKLLRDAVELDLSKSILIVNWVNDVLRNYPEMGEVNEWFQEYIDAFSGVPKKGKRDQKEADALKVKKILFTMFRPTLSQKTIDMDVMNATQIEDFYARLPQMEIEDLDKWLDGSVRNGSRGNLATSARGNFGVQKSHIALLDELQNWTKNNGAQTAQMLQNRILPLMAAETRITEEIERKRKQLEDMDRNMQNYADKYLYVMSCIRKSIEFYLPKKVHGSNFDGLIYPLKDAPQCFEKGKYNTGMKMTYAEEVEELDSHLRGHDKGETFFVGPWREPGALETELADFRTGKSIGDPLTCEASIKRLLRVVGYQIMSTEFVKFERHQIDSKHRSDLIADNHQGGVIKQLVGEQIRRIFGETFPRMLEHIRFLCLRPMALAHSTLLQAFPDMEGMTEFQGALDNTFYQWLNDLLNACNATLLSMMEEKMITFPVDLDTRLIQLLRLTPLKDKFDLLPNLHRREGRHGGGYKPRQEEEEDEEEEEELPRKADEEKESSLLSPGSTADESGHGEHKDKKDFDAYLDVRDAIRASQVTASPEGIRFVEGGLTGIPTVEANEDTQLANEIGRKFFVQIKGLLTLELESKVHMYLMKPLAQDRGADDTLHERMGQTVQRFKNSEEMKDIWKKSLGTDELEKQLEKKKARKSKIEESLRILNMNLHGNHGSRL